MHRALAAMLASTMSIAILAVLNEVRANTPSSDFHFRLRWNFLKDKFKKEHSVL